MGGGPILERHHIITGRNEVLAKVIFSEACVILSTGGGCLLQMFGGGVCLLQMFGWGGVCSKFGGGLLQIFEGVGGWGLGGCLLQIFGGRGCLQFSEYGQRSAGTHPTGMHSC